MLDYFKQSHIISSENVILSCTTTSERIHIFYYTAQSILRQTLKPNKIFLNISKNPYLDDKGIKKIPSWLHDSNININVVDNTGSYRKLLPIINYISDDDLVVTADDDVLYHSLWLEKLIHYAKNYPHYIICSRARKIRKNIFGLYQNYNNWNYSSTKNIGYWLLPIGCGGIVYRKRLLDLDILLDPKYKEIAPTNDDLWFRVSSMKLGVNVVVVPEIDQENIYLKHKKGLDRYNIYQYKKDKIIGKLYFKIYNKIASYLGINLSKNDIAWDEIQKYLHYNF